MKKINTNSALGIFFVMVLALIFLINLLASDKSFSEEENRVLQKFPSFSLSSYLEGRYEKKLDTYASDQFLLRNQLIKVKTSLDVTCGKLESNGVYRAKDHYLMEALQVPTNHWMERTSDSLEQFKRTYKDLDMYFMLAPNAANILKDKLSPSVNMNDQNQAMDAFLDNVKDAGITPIDIRKTLSAYAAQDNVQLYYKTDHHWTTDGAFIAYKDAVKKMKLTDQVSYKRYVVKNDFRGTLASKSGFVNGENDPLSIYLPNNDKDYHNSVIYYADTKEKTTNFYHLDNLDEKDTYTVFGGSNHPIYTIKTPTADNRRLLLIKDSYANSMIPFLAQNYREIVVVDPRYFYENIEDIIKAEEVTDVLFLYNANTFFADNSLSMMLTA